MVSQGLTQVSTILLGIVLARWLLSQETFGTYRQTFLVYTFIAGLFSLQLGSSLYYFIPKLEAEMRKLLLGQTILGTSILSLFIMLGMFFGAGHIARMFHNPELVGLVRILSLYAIADGILQLIPAFMLSLDRAIRAGVYSITAAFGRMVLTIAAFKYGLGLPAVMWVSVISSCLIAAIGIVDMIRLSPGRWRIERGLIMEQFHYAWPLWAGSIGAMINSQFDKVLISTFFNPETYAIYYCGAMELPIVALISQSISTAIMPNLVSMAAQNKANDAIFIWQEAARKSSLILYPCFAFFMVIGMDLMVFLYGNQYVMAGWPFRIYLLGLPLRVVFYSSILRAFGETKSIAISIFLSLACNITVSLSLVFFGKGTLLAFIGPSIGTVVAALVSGGYLLHKTSKITKISIKHVMRWKELGLILFVSSVAGLVVWLIPLPTMTIIIKLFIKTILFAIILFVIMILAKILHNDEKEMLRVPLRIARHLLTNKVF